MPRGRVELRGLDVRYMTCVAAGMTEANQGDAVRLNAGPLTEPSVSIGNDDLFGKVISVEVEGGTHANPLHTKASVQYRGMAEFRVVADGLGNFPVARDMVRCMDQGAVVLDAANGNKMVVAVGNQVPGAETVWVDLG